MRGIDELWDGRRCSEVSDPLGFHYVFYGALILNEGDDPHLCSTFGALQGIYLVDSLDARGPTTSTELTPIVALLFFRWERGELSAFTSTPTGIPSVIPGD